MLRLDRSATFASKESVIDYEFASPPDRNSRPSVDRQDTAFLLAPNHCRYADPDCARMLSSRGRRHHLYADGVRAILFNKNAFESFALRRMGAFSIFTARAIDAKQSDGRIGILANRRHDHSCCSPKARPTAPTICSNRCRRRQFHRPHGGQEARQSWPRRSSLMHPTVANFKYLLPPATPGVWARTNNPPANRNHTELAGETTRSNHRPGSFIAAFDASLRRPNLALKGNEHIGKASRGRPPPRYATPLIRFLLQRMRTTLPTSRHPMDDDIPRTRPEDSRAPIRDRHSFYPSQNGPRDPDDVPAFDCRDRRTWPNSCSRFPTSNLHARKNSPTLRESRNDSTHSKKAIHGNKAKRDDADESDH